MMTKRMIVLVRRRIRRGGEGGEDGDKRVSSVEFIGRDARGTFVKGIIAMNIEIRRVSGRG
jgi:ribose 1,5-bisphosphokinase PhnN